MLALANGGNWGRVGESCIACGAPRAYADVLTVDDARLTFIEALLGGRKRWTTGDGARTGGDSSTEPPGIASERD